MAIEDKEIKRKIKAFEWIDDNVDDLLIEWTGTHHHIYNVAGEGKVRMGKGRLLLEAIEDCYT